MITSFDLTPAIALVLLACAGRFSAASGAPPGGAAHSGQSAPSSCPAGSIMRLEGTAGPAPTLPAGGVQIAFRSLGGHVLVPVRFGEAGSVEMVLDTGMSAPIILLHDEAAARVLGDADGRPVEIRGAGSGPPVRGRVVSGIAASIGDLALAGQTVVVVDRLCGSTSLFLGGVIGKSIFDAYSVEIDFDRSLLTLRHPDTAVLEGGQSLPLDLSSGIPVLEAAVERDDGPPVPVRLVLDLGARHALSLHPRDGIGLRVPPGSIPTIVGRGLQGEVAGTVGRIRGLQLGPFRLPEVVASFTAPLSGMSCATAGSAADGNLGIEIIRRFRAVIDYPGRRLLLSPRSGAEGTPFEYNMAGLSLEQLEDGAYLVRNVIAGSPGEEAGVLRGDRILAIDGRRSSGDSYPRDQRMFGTPGVTLLLTIEREGTSLELQVRLRRLV